MFLNNQYSIYRQQTKDETEDNEARSSDVLKVHK